MLKPNIEMTPGEFEIPDEVLEEKAEYTPEIRQRFDFEKMRWKDRPKIKKCWKGENPIWNEEGDNYQSQLLCLVYGIYINPDGFTCKLCRKGVWPNKEKAVTMINALLETEPLYDALAFAEQRLIREVEKGNLTEQEAMEVIDRTGLDKVLEKTRPGETENTS